MVTRTKKHASLYSTEAAVAEAVVRFSAGNQKASSQILSKLSIKRMSIKRMADAEQLNPYASVALLRMCVGH